MHIVVMNNVNSIVAHPRTVVQYTVKRETPQKFTV